MCFFYKVCNIFNVNFESLVNLMIILLIFKIFIFNLKLLIYNTLKSNLEFKYN